MGQLVSNARTPGPLFSSRRQQSPPNAAVALESVFSNRPISVAYVRSDSVHRAASHTRRRSVLRRPSQSEAPSRRASTSHRSRRFSIFLARPVYPSLRRAGPNIVHSNFTTPLSDDADIDNGNVLRYCDVCSDHVNVEIHIHTQYAENHKQDNDYWSIENARIPWCNYCRVYFPSQSMYREHIMSVMRHNRRLAEAGRSGTLEIANGSNAALSVHTAQTQSENLPEATDRWRCLPCRRLFNTVEDLEEHQRLLGCDYVVDGNPRPPIPTRPVSEVPPLPPTRSNSTFSRISWRSNAVRSRQSTGTRSRAPRSRARSRSSTSNRFNRPIPFRSVSMGLAHSSASDRPRAGDRQPSFEEWLASTFRGSPPASLQTDVESTAASSRRSSFFTTAARRARHAIVVYRRSSAISLTGSTKEIETSGNTAMGFLYPCSICMSEGEELSSLACGHVFGSECLCLALRSKPECPLCRTHAHPRDMRRIYLT